MAMSGMRAVWEIGSTTVVVLIAITMLVSYHQDRAGGEDLLRTVPEALRNWEEPGPSAIRFGAEDPEIVVTIFMDFSCPFCRTVSFALDSVMAEMPGLVAVDFFHFPLRGHLDAVPDAIKAECADRQGRFKEMYRILFATAGQRDLISNRGLAERAEIQDPGEFIECIQGMPEDFPRIARGREIGDSLGVSGTPTIWINGRFFEGRDLAAFRKETEALRRTEKHSPSL